MKEAGGLARAAFLTTAGLAGAAPLAWAWLAPDVGRWLLLGAIGWLLGVALKAPLAGGFAWYAPRLGAWPFAVAMGLLSAVSELGVVAAMIGSRPPTHLAPALALGVGAGCLEALALAVYAAMASTNEAEAEAGETIAGPGDAAAGPGGWLDALAFPIERLIVALPGHVGSRALVAATCLGLGAGWAIAAVVAFAVVDGLPSWGERVGWVWTDAKTLGRYYLLAGMIGWSELALAFFALS